MGNIPIGTQGFTPVIDDLAQEVGLLAALVYGAVWRYCKMEDKVCYASIESIARRCHIAPSTAKRHLKKLVALGYLEDTTPDRRHAPHVYRDTGKTGLEAHLKAKTKVEQKDPPADQEVGQRSRPVGHSDPPRSVTKTHKESIQDTDKDTTNNGANAPSSLVPTSEPEILLFKLLAREQAAKRRKPPKRFPSMACKDEFAQQAARLGDRLPTALNAALVKGIISISAVVNYIGGFDNGRNSTRTSGTGQAPGKASAQGPTDGNGRTAGSQDGGAVTGIDQAIAEQYEFEERLKQTRAAERAAKAAADDPL